MPAFVSPVLIYSDGYSVEISWSGAGGVGVGGGGELRTLRKQHIAHSALYFYDLS